MALLVLTAYQNRTNDFTGTLSTSVTLAVTDRLRFKMGRREAATPSLDLVEDTVTANGSRVDVTDATTKAYSLRLAQGDLASLTTGVYDAELLLVDDSETAPADAIKVSDHGVLYLLPQMGGNVS